jgi:hypothetical protein
MVSPIVPDRSTPANRVALSVEPETLLSGRAVRRTMTGVRPDQGGSMHLKQNRFLSILATTAAVLAVGAAPALAGEDDDGDDDETPVQTAPAQVPSASSSSSSGVVAGAPQGGVATGAGGTAAAQGPDAMLLGLASGALVLMATGGGVLRAARRTQA